ncbi:MAG: hypothetical protein RIR29_33 [Actinomycetota bacterium]
MKKLFALIVAAVFVFAGTTPAKADITFDDRTTFWGGWYSASNWATISVNGSIQEGSTFQVRVDATIPNNFICSTSFWKIANGGVSTPVAVNMRGTYSQSLNVVAGAAGTSANYTGVFDCLDTSNNTRNGWSTSLAQITFETAIGTPSNFSVFPQAAGTAFTTWGIASGATGYRVTATPGGATCTTTDNYCVITGLTPGATYNFSVVATNGSATGPAVSSGSVILREPVTVGVGLNGGTWRVGDTVSAQYALQGSNANPTITWYRCSGVVGAMPTAPVGDCSSVGSGASYVLTAGDVGKYVTAHVFVNNTDPQGQMTASSNTAVLASGAVAPAPVADPAGKPTIVDIPNPIVSVAGGTEVTITGTGLAGVTSVTIGGVPAIVVSKTDTSVVVKVPNSTKVGLADLTVTNSKGSITSKSAIIYTTNPVIKVTKTKTLTGFTASQKVLTAAQKTAVKTLITANPTLTTLSCAAKTTGIAASKSELAKAKTLATATCAYAKSLNKNLLITSTASQTLPKGKASRTVALTLKN